MTCAEPMLGSSTAFQSCPSVSQRFNSVCVCLSVCLCALFQSSYRLSQKATNGLEYLCLMSYDISYVVCLVSYVFHVALAYVLMFRDAYVCFLCFVISFPNPTRVARSCSITNCIVLSVLFLFLVLVLIHSYI